MVSVQCAAGTFYNNNSQLCESCAKDSYQDMGGESMCTPCNTGQTTQSTGSSNILDCFGKSCLILV